MGTIIRKENTADLDRFYFHDRFFDGFAFDYPQRLVQFDVVSPEQDQALHMIFRQVEAMQWQGLNLWRGGSSLYHLWVDEDPEYFEQIRNQAEENMGQETFFPKDADYLSIILQLISGDELKITCRELEIRTEDFLPDFE